MTAIDKFIRLEAVGYWFEPGRQEAREVIVSFGDATLQLTSLQDVPLTHWALLATRRIGTRGEAVIYSADPEDREILEIDDAEMNRAISAVSSALATPQNPSSKWRWLKRGVLLTLLLAALSQTPPLIYSMAATITPPARMVMVSAQMQDDLRAKFGPECKGWQGGRALVAFAEKLFPEDAPEILVFDGMAGQARTLPASVVVLSRQALENAGSADELAARVTLAWASGQDGQIKQALIKAMGPVGALRYLITGTFGQPLPEITPRPEGADFILARDHLLAINAAPTSLRRLAEASRIGLPLPPNNLPAFEFSDLETLQNICAE